MASSSASSRAGSRTPFARISDDDTDPQWLAQTIPQYADMKNDLAVEGRRLVLMLEAPQGSTEEPRAPQSSFQDVTQLARYGWSFRMDTGYAQVRKEDLERLEHAFIGLKGMNTSISRKASDWHRIQLTHNIDNTGYPKTHGVYDTLVNFRDGVIVTLQSLGPSWHNYHRYLFIPEKQQVPLRDWFDVMFLGLRKAALELGESPEKIKDIRHIFHLDLENETTKTMCALVTSNTGNVNHWPSRFPSKTYKVMADKPHQALALLGTPDGRDIAAFVLSHKEFFGVRGIDRVNVFSSCREWNGDKLYEWCIYMHVTDGPLGFVREE